MYFFILARTSLQKSETINILFYAGLQFSRWWRPIMIIRYRSAAKNELEPIKLCQSRYTCQNFRCFRNSKTKSHERSSTMSTCSVNDSSTSIRKGHDNQSLWKCAYVFDAIISAQNRKNNLPPTAEFFFSRSAPCDHVTHVVLMEKLEVGSFPPSHMSRSWPNIYTRSIARTETVMWPF